MMTYLEVIFSLAQSFWDVKGTHLLAQKCLRANFKGSLEAPLRIFD